MDETLLAQLAGQELLDVLPVGQLKPAALDEQLGQGDVLAAGPEQAGVNELMGSIRSACKATIPNSKLRSVPMWASWKDSWTERSPELYQRLRTRTIRSDHGRRGADHVP